MWPAGGGETSLFYMELRSGGGLTQVRRTTDDTDGNEVVNQPSVLPDALRDALPTFCQRLTETISMDVTIRNCNIRSDFETPDVRYIGCDLYDADGLLPLNFTLEIAPEFRFVGLYSNENNGVVDPVENPPISRDPERLVCSTDATLAFDAKYWGLTESQYVISSDAVLTLQQAFDLAVSSVLERSGMTKEQLIQLPLSYGYLDKSNFGGAYGDWRFEWNADPNDPMNRYWISFSDMPEPNDISYSAPGEGLG